MEFYPEDLSDMVDEIINTIPKKVFLHVEDNGWGPQVSVFSSLEKAEAKYGERPFEEAEIDEYCK